ncbi:hypothetical protein Tco_0216089 [Tanacetum coccineum]
MLSRDPSLITDRLLCAKMLCDAHIRALVSVVKSVTALRVTLFVSEQFPIACISNQNHAIIQTLMSPYKTCKVCNNNVFLAHAKDVVAMNTMEFVFIVKLEMGHKSMFLFHISLSISPWVATIPTNQIRTILSEKKKKSESRLEERSSGLKCSILDRFPFAYDDDEDNTIGNSPLRFNNKEPDVTRSYVETRVSAKQYRRVCASADELPPHFYLFLEETNTFDNSIPESETFRFNLEEISSGSPTTLSWTIFRYDLFPPADRVDLINMRSSANELTHIMSPPELECFKFKIEPDPGDLDSIDLGIRKNASTTNVNVPLEDDQSSLRFVMDRTAFAFLSLSRCPPPPPTHPTYLLSNQE